MKAPSWTRFYLLLSALGLLVAALIYGVAPAVVLPMFLDVAVEGTDLTHVFRVIMGLYLAMAVLWLVGALRPSLARAAVISEITFMFGLAMGRALSIVVDGVPSPLLVASTMVEFVMGLWGVLILRQLPENRSRGL